MRSNSYKSVYVSNSDYDYTCLDGCFSKRNPLYISPPCGTIDASVWDLSSTNGLPESIQSETVDIVILIFVLSALHPNEWTHAISNIYKVSALPHYDKSN